MLSFFLYLYKAIYVIQTKPILNDPIVIEYLKHLQDRFVIVPIDKAAYNFSFICKMYCVKIA